MKHIPTSALSLVESQFKKRSGGIETSRPLSIRPARVKFYRLPPARVLLTGAGVARGPPIAHTRSLRAKKYHFLPSLALCSPCPTPVFTVFLTSAVRVLPRFHFPPPLCTGGIGATERRRSTALTLWRRRRVDPRREGRRLGRVARNRKCAPSGSGAHSASTSRNDKTLFFRRLWHILIPSGRRRSRFFWPIRTAFARWGDRAPPRPPSGGPRPGGGEWRSGAGVTSSRVLPGALTA